MLTTSAAAGSPGAPSTIETRTTTEPPTTSRSSRSGRTPFKRRFGRLVGRLGTRQLKNGEIRSFSRVLPVALDVILSRVAHILQSGNEIEKMLSRSSVCKPGMHNMIP